MKKTDKPVFYTAMMVLVEMEVRADSQEHADAILKHKLQMVAATNADLAVNKLVNKEPFRFSRGFDLEPLP
jgi:hypothetical protein